MRALCASLGWIFVSHLVCISLCEVFRSGHTLFGGAQVVENKGILQVFAGVAKLLQMFLQVLKCLLRTVAEKTAMMRNAALLYRARTKASGISIKQNSTA